MNKLILSLLLGLVGVLLVLVGFLAATIWNQPKNGHKDDRGKDGRVTDKSTDKGRDKTKVPPKSLEPEIPPGTKVNRDEVSKPPPPPKPVANPDRVRQNLQPGKTYVTHTKGTLNVRATDKDWGIEKVITLNYGFEAQIDREIESNDGTTIVELRHFRDVRSIKVLCKLEDVRLDLGPAGEYLLPESIRNAVDNLSLKPLLQGLRWSGISPEELTNLGDEVKAFRAIDQLTGKSVRLTYVDGKGVVKVEPVRKGMTKRERDFHFASALLSDSLIIPDVDIKIGNRWSVDGSNFANLIDPSLLSRISGEIVLERKPDHIVQNRICRHLKVDSGRLKIDDSDERVGQIGYFDPKGSMYFSTDDQVIIQAKLQGKAQLEKFSKDHLLFEARMRALPELNIVYTCRVTDTLKKPAP